MNRRQLITGIGALSVSFTAGCLGSNEEETDTPAETGTSTQTENDTQTDSGDHHTTQTDSPTNTDEHTSTETYTSEETVTETEGYDGSGGDTPTEYSEPEGTATRTPDPTKDADHIVKVGPNDTATYSPSSLTVNIGETVVWVWESDNHNVRPNSDKGGFSGSPGGESDIYDKGYSFEHTFDYSGTYEYYCAFHPGMTGEIVVK